MLHMITFDKIKYLLSIKNCVFSDSHVASSLFFFIINQCDLFNHLTVDPIPHILS